MVWAVNFLLKDYWNMMFVKLFLTVLMQYITTYNPAEPPPASEAAKLARYVLHCSGKNSSVLISGMFQNT